MQYRGKVMNRLALMMLTIIVLELILIGDQVQPIKRIKKKLYLKKFKRLFPLPSLMKPKKKVVLIPIPIPIFKISGNRQHFVQPNLQNNNNDKPNPQVPTMMMSSRPILPIDSSLPPMTMTMLPMSMIPMDSNADPFSMMGFDTGPAPRPVTQNESYPQPSMPSMTMTIQSEPGGSSAIELSTSLMGSRLPNASLPLKQRPQHSNKSYLQQQHENLDEPTEQLESEQYYLTSWPTKWPPASPAKMFRSERLRANKPLLQSVPVGLDQLRDQPSPTVRAQRQQRQAILVLKDQWRKQGFK